MDKYILDEMDKLNELAHSGASTKDVMVYMDKIKELMVKNEKMKEEYNDPNRLQPFGTPEEPSDKNLGSM